MVYETMNTVALRHECAARNLAVSARSASPKTGRIHCNWLKDEELKQQLLAVDNGVAPPFGYARGKGKSKTAPAPVAPVAPVAPAPAAPPPTKPKKAPKEKKEICLSLFKFFSEWQIEPQTRFVASIASQPNTEAAKEFVAGYFRLTNNPYASEIEEKLKSPEASKLFADATSKLGWRSCNTRLELYFGPPGSGKTSAAIAAHPDADVVVCDASMSPDELFRGFTFEEGKPVFKGSPLATAMKEGKVVILDEINLLSRECLRALQAVTDGKPTATVGTEKINIKDGFRIVGTMNLVVDGNTEGIPGPLVDRAAVIKETKLDASGLADLCETYLS